jgi:hypothetical protein
MPTLVLGLLMLVSPVTQAADSLFRVEFDEGAITSLEQQAGAYGTNYVREGRRLGDVIVRYRQGEGDWTTFSTAEQAEDGRLTIQHDPESGAYAAVATNDEVRLRVGYGLRDGDLRWTIELTNRTDRPVEVGDVALPFPMDHDWTWDRETLYRQRVVRHSMVAGHHSFAFWSRVNAEGPYLLMTPMGDTHLEYYDHGSGDGDAPYTAYIHSRAQEEVIRKEGGSWRQPHTSTTLQPAGTEQARWRAGFRFEWAEDYAGVRERLYEHGLFNIDVAPGMTVPRALPVKLALRNRAVVHRIEAESPDETTLTHLRTRADGTRIYEIDFRRLGENKLTVRYGDGRHLILEFFVTQSIETLLRKRGRFLVERQQIRDTTTWYHGLLSDWNMQDEVLLSPKNLHNIPESRRYMVASDDPGLGRPSFLAAKNAIYPVQRQVDALDTYIQAFAWGGLQMTPTEAYPYAVYGIPDWKQNRESEAMGTDGRSHVWRIYDYPHVLLMYLSMYRIARHYPGIETALSWRAYLRRAYGTAMAYYRYPEELQDWSPYETGTYNELVTTDLIEALEREGDSLRAFRLRRHWERKVDFFVGGNANLFASEYPYDPTGFESTHAFARYAVEHAGRTRSEELPLDTTVAAARAFMDRQIRMNVGSRGWIEKAYFLYGSDYRGGGSASYTLSYMSQMAGWSILDYSLYYADNPHRYLRLGYGSILSSWALMNTGTPESDHGYWFPGKRNDGGAGGGFEPLAYGETWLEQPHGRGSWYYGCEIDLGFSGYLRAAATILTDDPVFGLTAFGGTLDRAETEVRVTPRDGVRRRFHVLRDEQRFHLTLLHDRLAAGAPIVVADDLSRLQFTVENAGTAAAPATLTLEGLPAGRYEVQFDGEVLATLQGGEAEVRLPVSADQHEVLIHHLEPTQ